MDLTSLYPGTAYRKDAGPSGACLFVPPYNKCSPFSSTEWMNEAASLDPSWEGMAFEQDQRISDIVKRERTRLLNFIRSRVDDPGDAEDILQDVFYRLVQANRLLMPIEHVTGWLFRVARNRITDLFRKKEPENFSDVVPAEGDDGESWSMEDLLPSPDAGPEAQYVREILLDETGAGTG